ncbi:beta-galactosidase [Sphaerisporangium sp. NPDC088356]|uniref:beta-galactosidase n=1 Tax=Sphaerisporangium sp. NPDC088356 TaxID=3154871 RepID=UPI003432A754
MLRGARRQHGGPVPAPAPGGAVDRRARLDAGRRPGAPHAVRRHPEQLHRHHAGLPGRRVRLWDSETRWAQIQPKRGEFDWTVLDRLVGGAHDAGLPALFVMGGTPAWASPRRPSRAVPGRFQGLAAR